MSKFYPFVLTIILLVGCRITNRDVAPYAEETIIWVNSYQTDCRHDKTLHCFLIQRGHGYHEAEWEHYNGMISGFNFEQGFLYKLSIEEESLRDQQFPDSVNVSYALVEVLLKLRDDKLMMSNVWILTGMDGNEYEYQGTGLGAYMDIHVSDMNLSGHAPCNKFSGKLKYLDTVRVDFEKIISTRMHCPEMEDEQKYLQSLEQTEQYRIDSNILILFGNSGVELLRFKSME